LAKTFVDFIPGYCMNKRPSIMYGQFQASKQAIAKTVYFDLR
jgi:hypothetical protein